MVVIDGTSFIALVHNIAGSAIQRVVQRGIDEGDEPFLLIAAETEREATEGYVADHGPAGLARLKQRMEETELTVLPWMTCRKAQAYAVFEQYGQGRLPGTFLTLGDCATVALAKRIQADLICETGELARIYRNPSD